MAKRGMTLDSKLAAEAKSLVALAFRNGPIEDVHAGKECPTCAGKSEYSHLTQAEMKNIMKQAVDSGLQVALAETERSREIRDDD